MADAHELEVRDDISYQLHPYTNARQHESNGPLIIDRGEGVWVYDDQGNAYIEGMAGLWCTALGFSEPRLVKAATAQLERLPFYHTFNGKSTAPATELAARLAQLAPLETGKVIYSNSGSAANDTAIKLVWYYNNALGRQRKKKIISRLKAYHGVTLATASLTGLPNNHQDFDLPIDNVLHTACPHHYRYAAPGESETDFASRLATELEQLIVQEDPDTIAAFIGEPVMGAGGVLVPPASYWDKIQAVLKKYDILLIADEVICGFGRTGHLFGCETFGIRPDIMTVAKQLSSAYLPIAATLINDHVYQVIADNSARIGTLGHGFTYGGHPVSAAVALETLKIYQERDIVSRVQGIAPRLQQGLQALGQHPLVGEVRGVGLMAALELVANQASRAPFPQPGQVGNYMVQRAQEHGLIVRSIGDALAFCPPLIISETEIDLLLDRVRQALDETWHWTRTQDLIE